MGEPTRTWQQQYWDKRQKEDDRAALIGGISRLILFVGGVFIVVHFLVKYW